MRGRLKAPYQVRAEIAKGRDAELTEWCKQNKILFVNSKYMIPLAADVVRRHPRLVKPHKSGEEADPFLIALALILRNNIDTPEVVIVTQESARSEIKIPRVAREYGFESIKLLDLIRRERWRF